MAGDDAGWQQAIRAAQTAFFLDVDGTLLGFEERPEDVVADAELLVLLRRLLSASGGAVALVSGRLVEDLDRIVAPLVLPAAGVHGADLRYPDGRRSGYHEHTLVEARAAARRFVDAHPGLRLEEKGIAAFAIHYRQAPGLKATVAAFLAQARLGPELAIQHGKMVAEVRPHGCHKGLAIETLMQEPPFTGRSPLFIGDDLTDEYGFDAVNRAGGLSVKVGDAAHETAARHRIANVAAVRTLLKVVCEKADVEK